MAKENFRKKINLNRCTKKTALYLVGGGLDSASSAGMLSAIEHLQLQNEFDLMVGASAGSFIGVYLMTEAARIGSTGYWRVMPEFSRNRNYFNPYAPLKGKPILDTQKIVENLLTEMVPVDWSLMIDHPLNQSGRFLVQVFCADTGGVYFLHQFKTVEALKLAVSASCYIPVLSGISPFRFGPSALEQMKVLDQNGDLFTGRYLDVFDGLIGDPYFEKARTIFNDHTSLILDPLHPEKYSEYESMLGNRLKWLEQVTARALYRQYPQAVDNYIDIIVKGQIVEHAKRALYRHQQNTGCTQVIHPDRRIDIDLRGETREALIKEKVISGWNGFYDWMGLKPQPLPKAWQDIRSGQNAFVDEKVNSASNTQSQRAKQKVS